MDITPIDLMKNKPFRCIIFGRSASGKTYLLLNEILPGIIDKFTIIFVMTRQHNRSRYKKALDQYLKGRSIRFIYSDFGKHLDKIYNKQKDNTVKMNGKEVLDEDDDPMFHDEILIIWDDVLDKKLFDSDDFKRSFNNFRHVHISTILLTQETNKTINPQIKSNNSLSIFFPLGSGGDSQRNEMFRCMGDCISAEKPLISPKDSKKIAANLYIEYVAKKKYGFICTTEYCGMFKNLVEKIQL